MDKKRIGQKISTLRKEKGMTQKELAEKLCVTDKSVSKWETGVHFPDIEIMERLASELGITVSDLLGFEKVTSEEVIKVMTEVSMEEKKKIRKTMKYQAYTQIFCGLIVSSALIYLSYILYMQGLRGGVYGVCTIGMLAFVCEQIGNGIYSLINMKKL